MSNTDLNPVSSPAPPEPPDRASARNMAFWLASVLALGVVVRLILFASGRSPLDGDEAIMGMMGADLRYLHRIPLYFYGQSYLGAIEIPLLAFIQLLGVTRDWAYSVWPIRITACAYIAALGAIHFRLTRRFFGSTVALAAVFFLTLGPYAWLDYSSRLRHVVFMMALGELLILLTLRLIERWNDERRVESRVLLALGVLSGLAWWHYQLVAIFFIAMLALLLIYSSYIPDLFRGPILRRGQEGKIPQRVRSGGAMLTIPAVLPVAIFVAMTLGKGWSYWPYYEWILLGLGIFFAAAFVLPWRRYLSERSDFTSRADPALSPSGPLQHFSPALILLGFVLGSIPTFIYMSTLHQEFWVHPTAIDLYSLIDRLDSTFWTEVAPMLDIVREDSFNSATGTYASPATIRTYFYLGFYCIGAYVLFRRFRKPERRFERLGVVYVILLGALILFFRAGLPRNLSSLSPRFVMPLLIPASVIFGLAMDELLASLAPAGRPPVLRRIVAGLLAASCLVLFGLSWREAPAESIDLKTGHRHYALNIVNALRKHGVRRIYIEYHPGSNQVGWIPLGWELMFASHNEIRFQWATFDDRLYGLLDEDSYGWDEYYMYQRDLEVREADAIWGPEIESAPGFDAEDYRVIRLPENYAPHRGWLPWSPRGSDPQPGGQQG